MNSNKYKVLIMEDERNIRHFVRTILTANGYQVVEAKTLAEGRMAFMSHSPDVVILDLGLPDGDGMEFLKLVRKDFSTPVIVLSARTDEKDKVLALDEGANDYITKPFGTAELQARVRAALRVHQQNLNRCLGGENNFKLGDMIIDYDTRHVLIKGEDIKLTQTEYNIVALLAAHAGKVMTYAEIIKEIWKWSDAGSIKKLQVNMANIRKKMGIKPGDSQYIINELGVGYRMNVDIEAIEEYFRVIGNIERIGDHAVNIGGYVYVMEKNDVTFSEGAIEEIRKMQEICGKTMCLLTDMSDEPTEWLSKIAALEQQMDDMTVSYRNHHIERMKQGLCSEQGCILFSELLTDFERMGDHMLNIAQSYAKIAVV